MASIFHLGGSWLVSPFCTMGFLSHDECDHLIALAKGKSEKSMVADNESGKRAMSEVPTCTGMFLCKRQDEIGVREGLRLGPFFQKKMLESMQILHCEPHFDYFHDQTNQELGGHRVATVLMYLSNVQKDGERLSCPTQSLHGSCPVIEGEKWSATKWIHVRPFDKPEKQRSREGRVDENVPCPQWAADGVCVKNPPYMVGRVK